MPAGQSVVVPPHLPVSYSRMLQHCPFTETWAIGQVVVVGVGQSLPMQVGSTGCGQFGPWQPGSTKKHWPLRPLRAPSGQAVTMLPHFPAAMASRVQHVPLLANVGNGQDVVVGVGQLPSLLR